MSNIMKPPPEYGTPSVQGFTPPPMVYSLPAKKSHRWVWITVGIVALLCILGGTLLAFYYNSPLRASDMYYSAIKTQDYSTAYTYLGSRMQTAYSQQAFTQAAQQQDAALGTVSSFGMSNIPTSDPAYVTLTVTRANGSTYTVHLELQQEGGAWKVTAFDRI